MSAPLVVLLSGLALSPQTEWTRFEPSDAADAAEEVGGAAADWTRIEPPDFHSKVGNTSSLLAALVVLLSGLALSPLTDWTRLEPPEAAGAAGEVGGAAADWTRVEPPDFHSKVGITSPFLLFVATSWKAALLPLLLPSLPPGRPRCCSATALSPSCGVGVVVATSWKAALLLLAPLVVLLSGPALGPLTEWTRFEPPDAAGAAEEVGGAAADWTRVEPPDFHSKVGITSSLLAPLVVLLSAGPHRRWEKSMSIMKAPMPGFFFFFFLFFFGAATPRSLACSAAIPES